MTSAFGYVPERDDTFLSLFPHRYDYIYAPHPQPGDRPQWQTESRYPLSDRLIQQGSYLYGVRFGSHTRYCLLDIDVGSAYHPSRDPLAIARMVDALEPLGLVSYIACTSSYSQGLHLYFPFETAQPTWQLSAAVTTLLEVQGFRCRPGQLEIFPNSKLYVVEGTPNLFNAHRLPLQAGSYLLDAQFEPTLSSAAAFVEQWRHCERRNGVEAIAIAQVLKQIKRRRHRISVRADKFLNDLNAEIEPGWTGRGQTNYLLGRITMRCYIFHHVMYGGLPLAGEDLVNAIVEVATALPGYRDWCQHQHEIHQRAAEWTRCIENSHYFPYGAQQGKYKAKAEVSKSGTEVTWNQQRSQAAQAKIQVVMADLLASGELPTTATARFKKLLTYNIGGSTLYKYKFLWHPDLWKSPQTPHSSKEVETSAMAPPATAAHAPSLLSRDVRNSSEAECSSDSIQPISEPPARNSERQVWRQALATLKQRRIQQKTEQRSRFQAHKRGESAQYQRQRAQKMEAYLRSRDPILIREGLHWWVQQASVSDQPPWSSVLEADPGEDVRLEPLIEVCRALLELNWSPEEIRESLCQRFGQSAIAALSFEALRCWASHLRSQCLRQRGALGDGRS